MLSNAFAVPKVFIIFDSYSVLLDDVALNGYTPTEEFVILEVTLYELK